ncbi:sulfate transporter [Niabella ginsenosidivorans]|uniref:Sulfate transporter n=1 Tax=Niabella ginsenosidivorans TaxID=1176587 RepID=A0A1A9I4D6_9BACT|nr:putative sulfate exporter family transporter [Niabella ginsenosidivorans]ANH81434.1 sulfate transporter [Niabella ginsenosidivorans]
MSSVKQKIALSEDWTIVVLGFLIIFLALWGVIIDAPLFTWDSFSELSLNVLNRANLLKTGIQFLFVYAIAIAGTMIMGKSIQGMLKSFPVIYVLTIVAFIIGGNGKVKLLNMETVIFCLGIGLIVRNFFTVPAWLQQSLASEFFVKIGLVLLGTSVIFSDILKAGALGLIQALAVVLSVWYFSFWLCKKLKVDKELSLMLSSAVSICGVSAAIATSGAIKGDAKKLSLVVSLVLITAVPMMIAMPWIAGWLGLSEAITGAWLGGTIDTTGAVAASGSLVGETALKISTIVKFSQNVLLGIAAFAISVYWTYTKSTSKQAAVEKPTLKVIWERFPKFVVGFILASVIFSFFLDPGVSGQVKTPLKNLQGLWFALAFTSIGLETNFKDLVGIHNRKPVIAFLGAQLFNIFTTLIIAYFLFG